MSRGNDPVRLIADAGCPESQRALLRLGADIAPPRDAEARVWAALAGALGGAAVAAGAEASTKTTTTAANVKAGLLSMKVVALAAGLTALVALGLTVFAPPKSAAPPAAAPPAPAAATREPEPRPAAPPVEMPAEHAPTSAAPPAQAAAPHRSVSPARRLVEETTLIRDARQALRAGDTGRALRLLAESRRLFPSGVLQQERERLAVEALVKAERRTEASARARAFLRRYPDSPHASEIRALGVGQPESRP